MALPNTRMVQGSGLADVTRTDTCRPCCWPQGSPLLPYTQHGGQGFEACLLLSQIRRHRPRCIKRTSHTSPEARDSNIPQGHGHLSPIEVTHPCTKPHSVPTKFTQRDALVSHGLQSELLRKKKSSCCRCSWAARVPRSPDSFFLLFSRGG